MTTAAANEKDPVAPVTAEDAREAPIRRRTVAEIEAELDATRARLSSRLDDLQSYVSPRNVAERQVRRIKNSFVDEYGGIRPERVLVAGLAAIAILVGLRAMRRGRG
ncbi:unannotated protein [freshwater metagenome]|uniref:Unannotated protein n=1 Tax=freshwater metagenome TaxID=449393 RepID=A0A6J7C0R9_9ZZZZ